MRKALLASLPILGLLAVWKLVSVLGIYSAVLLPSPEEVAIAFARNWDDLLRHAGASLARVSIGVGGAFLTAVPLGILIGRYQILDELTDWVVQMFRSFPPISLIPLAVLFFGIGDKPALALIFVAAFWPLLLNTIFGVKNVERTLLKVARAANASEGLVFRDILLPNALPSIITGLRLALGAGWLTVVTAEMIAVKSGLGYMIMYAQVIFKSELILAGIITIGLIGLGFDQAIAVVRRRLFRWQEGLVIGA